ncbi:MAG: metallophosphatase [Sphingobacteriales bacterium JAD_PAG50586_3]|nr:MAG: metallophosphatase [Sphingobacteriales bacterium JAD_PAG50586_3]
MQNSRRTFLRYMLGAGGMLAFSNLSAADWFAKKETIKLTILHTNDVHSRLEPFPMNDPKFPGMGGAARRAALINSIRNTEPNVLLFDAGDIFQGTPYFNVYKGEPEMKLMSQMGYDAATIGNHDFDAGADGLATQLVHANFPMLNCNYDFADSPLEGKTVPHKIFNKGGLRIGVFGVGVELNGLVPKNLYGNIVYNNPVEKANATARYLKLNQKCDLVICLSHLGYSYTGSQVSDLVLAAQSEHINLIIGGHTHTFLDHPTRVKNNKGAEVLVNQVGWAGLRLGRIDYFISPGLNKHAVEGHALKIFKSQ